MNNFTEHINDNGKVLIWKPENEYNSSQILGMDLDWTLIKPVEGKVHSKHKDDWEFIPSTDSDNDILTNKLSQYKKYKYVIFTNQGGLLKGNVGLNLDEFKHKWLKIYEELKAYGFESVYMLAALYDDYFRKPCIGMWDYMENELNGKVKVDRSKSLYVGDMAGRKGDYAESDLLMAVNLDVPFQVPEVFWDNDKKKANSFEILKKNAMENDKVFKADKYLKDKETNIEINKKTAGKLIEYLKTNNSKVLVLFVGSPASGKSYFYNKYLEHMSKQETKDKSVVKNKLIYMSMDKYNGTLAKFIKEVNSIMTSGNDNILIDNTNGVKETRSKYVKIAKDNNYKVVVVQFDINKELVMHLNELRNKEITVCELNKLPNCKKHLPTVAINTFWKKFESPDIEEGFEEIIIAKFEFDFTKKEHISEDKFKLFL